MDKDWVRADEVLASEEHGCVSSRINAMLESVGIPAYGLEAHALGVALWETATPDSGLAHLFLALRDLEPEQVAEVGLDRFLVLRNALYRKCARYPAMAQYVNTLTLCCRSTR